MVLEPGLTPKQRLEKQRQLLKQRLGACRHAPRTPLRGTLPKSP